MTAFLKVKLAVFGGYWRLLDGIGAFWRTLVFSFVILEIKVSILGRICSTLTPYRKTKTTIVLGLALDRKGWWFHQAYSVKPQSQNPKTL
jgi:hypothetical protein